MESSPHWDTLESGVSMEDGHKKTGWTIETISEALLIPLNRMRIRFLRSELTKQSMQKKQSLHISRLLI